MKKLLLCCLTFLAIFNANGQLSGTYTIDPLQKVSKTNYQSINNALNDLENGHGISGPVIFKIANGNYQQSFYLNKINGVSAKNTISFTSMSNDSSKVNIQNSNGYEVITLDGARYISFKNITFSSSDNSYNSSIMLMENGASNISFKGCCFSGSSGRYVNNIVLTTNTDSDIVFDNNSWTDFSNGIYSNSNNGNTGLYTVTLKNNIFDSVTGGTSISLNSAFNVTISNNRIHAPLPNTSGMRLFYCTGDVSITKNMVNAGVGMVIDGSSTSRLNHGDISDNMVIGIGFGLEIIGVRNIDVYYNTFTIYDPTKLSNASCALTVEADSVYIEDNNIANFGTGFGILSSSSDTGISSNHNNIYSASGVIGSWNGSNKKTVADWTKASGLDSNSISVNPDFQNATDDHAHNPFLKAGIPISGYTTDIDNIVRNTKKPVIGANEFTVYRTDAGMNTIDSVGNSYCKGATVTVYGKIADYGTDTLTASTIGWSISGISQTGFNWTGKLGPGETMTIKLGAVTLDRTGYIKCWTNKFNTVSDSNHANDTVSRYVQVKMAGTYTMGGSGADFSGFNDAAKELERSGICGSVVINVNNGTYNEQVMFSFIKGESSINTITFQSTNEDSTKAVLQYPSTNDNYVPNYLIELYQAKYYNFKQLGFVRTGEDSNAAVLVVTTGCDSNNFTGNRFVSNHAHPVNLQYTYRNTTVDLQTSNHNNLQRNLIRNGSLGIYTFFPNQASTVYQENKFSGNTIDSSYYSGFHGYGHSVMFNNNDVINILDSGASGIYLSGDSIVIKNNKVFLPNGGYGIYFGFGMDPVSNALIFNNLVSVIGNLRIHGSYGIYCTVPLTSYANINNNNIYITGNDTLSSGLGFFGGYDYYASNSSASDNNNIIINNAGGYVINLWANLDLIGNNNDEFTNGKYFGSFPHFFSSAKYNTLKDWIQASKSDSNSISLVPWYKSLTDLHAQNPLLAGAGKPLAFVTSDIDGKPRNTKPTIGANEINPMANDAGVSALVNPSINFCAGNNDFVVSLRNYGSNTILTDSIVWQLDGKKQKPYAFSGKIVPGDSSIVDIGNGLLPGSTLNDWFASKYPNASNDLNHYNDTASFRFHASMHGVYTIGGSSPDFISVTEAINTLVTSKMCAPVIFNIRNGTYNEQVSMPAITGSSKINTITFEAETGDSTKVILTYPSSSKKTDSNYVIQLDSATNTIFKHISIVRTGTNANAAVIDLIHNPANNIFTGCRIIGTRSQVYTTDTAALVVTNHGHGSQDVFKNNLFKYGSYCYYYTDWQSIINGPNKTGTDSFIHNIIDSCLNGIVGVDDIFYPITTTYAGYNVITNFVYDALKGCKAVGNRIYSPLNLTEAISICKPLINNMISTSAPTALLHCDSVFYNNIVMFNSNLQCVGIIALDEQNLTQPAIENNVITFFATHPSTAVIYARTNSVTFSKNNAYSYYNQMEVLYNNLNNVYTYDAYNNDLDPELISISNPEVSNYELAHAGVPIPGIDIDINGHLRDPKTPSIGANEIPETYNNIAVVSLLPQQCGDTAYTISVIVQNRGTSRQSNIPISAEISNGDTIVKVSDFIDSLRPLSGNDTFTFKTPVSLYKSGIYNVKIYTALSNDENKLDDTSVTSLMIIGNVKPSKKNTTICTAARARLTLNNITDDDSIKWYRNANDAAPLSTKDTFVTGTISKDSTFYVSYASPQSFHMPWNDSGDYKTAYSSGKFLVLMQVYKSCILDSVTVYPQHSGSLRFSVGYGNIHTSFANSGTYVYNKFYAVNVKVNSPYQAVRVPLKIPLNYNGYNELALVVDSMSTGNLLFREATIPQYLNHPVEMPGVLTVNADSSDFGYANCNIPLWPCLFDWAISTSCEGNKFPYKVHVGGKPGFSLDKDPASQAVYHSGTLNDPDIISLKSSDVYRLYASYPDADYGKTWSVQSQSFESIGGATSTDTKFVLPSSKGVGQFIFSPVNFIQSDSIYKLTMSIVTTGACDSTVTRYIRVIPSTVPKFYAQNECVGHPVYFSDSTADSGAVAYSWDFGDSIGSSQKSPTHIYKKSGIYTAVLTVTNSFGQNDTVSHKIDIYQVPQPVFTADTIVCVGYPAKFNNNSTHTPGDSSLWHWGDGSKGDTGKSISHIYNKAGIYTATLFIKNAKGCIDSASKKIRILSRPNVSFKVTEVCPGDSTPFAYTGVDSGSTFLWSFGDKETSGLKNPNHLYPGIGAYNASLKLTNISGCADSASQKLIISPCVWPGDANDDKKVDMNDFLAIGVAFGTKGHPRPSASISWTGQPSPDWDSVFSSGVNYKHADCNGDSIVNYSDTVAISKNYGKTHPKSNVLNQGSITDPPFLIKSTTDTIYAGDTLKAVFSSGSATNKVQNIYGLLFSLGLNPLIFDLNNASIEIDPSFLGTRNIDLMGMKINDISTGLLDVGFTRTSHTNASGFGSFATLYVPVKSMLPQKKSKAAIGIYNNVQISYRGKNVPFYFSSDSFVVLQNKSGIENIIPDQLSDLNIFPNPFQNSTEIQYSISRISRVQIGLYDMTGKQIAIISNETQIPGTYRSEINAVKYHLITGIYQLRFMTDDGYVSRHIVKL